MTGSGHLSPSAERPLQTGVGHPLSAAECRLPPRTELPPSRTDGRLYTRTCLPAAVRWKGGSLAGSEAQLTAAFARCQWGLSTQSGPRELPKPAVCFTTKPDISSISKSKSDKVASGQWTNVQSLGLSGKALVELLTQGVQLADNYVFSFVDDRARPVGTL